MVASQNTALAQSATILTKNPLRVNAWCNHVQPGMFSTLLLVNASVITFQIALTWTMMISYSSSTQIAAHAAAITMSQQTQPLTTSIRNDARRDL